MSTPAPVARSIPLDPGRVRPGDILRFVMYAKVQQVGGVGVVHLVDLDRGNGFTVDGSELVVGAHSADFAAAEESVSNSDCAKLLMAAGQRPFTVRFTKKDGEERSLRGRLLYGADEVLGYARVEDLDNPAEDRIRLVDMRNLHWLVLDGVKYTVRRR